MTNKSSNKVCYSIYDGRTTWMLILGLTSMCILALGLSAFFVVRFLVISFDPGVFILLLIIDGPWVIVLANLLKQGFILRLLSRIRFAEEGVHISCFARPATVLRWDEIHTYGITRYSVAYASKTIIYMSKDRQELAPKSIKEANAISSKRISLECREEIWLSLLEYMPLDMKRKLSDSLNKERDGFFKR